MAKKKTVDEQTIQQNLPSKEEQEVISRVWNRFGVMRDARDQEYAFFNGRNLTTMVDDCQKRFNGYIEPRSGPDDWGAKTIDPMTRNKVVYILATLAAQRLKVRFFKQDDDDMVRAKVVNALYESSYMDGSEEIQVFNEMLSAVVKGTVIGYEGYKAPVVKIKKIKGYNIDTGVAEYETVEKRILNKVCSEIIPVEDFYPGDIRKRDIQAMPDCVWRSVTNIHTFKREFSKYKNIDKVKTGGETSTDSFFKNFISNGVTGEDVEVIRYFNKVDDEMHIIANGVLLTPLESPLVWNHKEKGLGLPFWSTIYEPFDEHFFYGKPLPDKLKSNQDVVDALYRMMLDQTFLSIHKPILTSSVKDIEDDLIRPGRKIPVDDVNEWKELNISSPDGGQFKMLEVARRSIEESSADATVTGNAPNKSGIPATAYMQAQQGAQTLLSMFQRFMEWGAEQKAKLRVPNIIQFYPYPIGLEDDGKPMYRKIRVDNVPLMLSPRNGSIIIKFVPTKADLPKTQEISEEMKKRFENKYGKRFDEIAVVRKNEAVEEVTMTPEFLDEFDCGVKVIADSSVKMSDAMKKALTLEFVDRAVRVFPDLFNRNVIARDLALEFDKNPDEYLLTSPSEQEAAIYRMQQIAGNDVQDRDFMRSSDMVDKMTGSGQAAQQTELGSLANPKASSSLADILKRGSY